MLLFALGGFVGAIITLITYGVIISGRDANNYYRILRENEELRAELRKAKDNGKSNNRNP